MFQETVTYPTATLKVNLSTSTLICSFRGNIEFGEYKAVLLAAVDAVAQHKITNIMMNRLEVVELPPECRIWVKNEYLKKHIKPHIPNLNKVAVVESKSLFGALAGKAIYRMLSFIYPNLTFRFFKTVSSGLAWFAGEHQPSVEEESLEDELVFEEELVGEKIDVQKDRLLDKILNFFFKN